MFLGTMHRDTTRSERLVSAAVRCIGRVCDQEGVHMVLSQSRLRDIRDCD